MLPTIFIFRKVDRMVLFCGLLCCLVFWSGCGQKTYEERLQRSARFYQYLNTVEENLSSPPWKRRDLGLSLRLPKPFERPMAGPEVFKDQTGEESLGPDPRQQNVLGTPLPGLIEAWEGTLESDSPDAWVFILSNHDRFVAESGTGPDPKEFLTDLEIDLMRVFRVSVPEGETSQPKDNARFRLWLPAQNSDRAMYTSPKDYIVIRFVPDPEYDASGLEATLYERQVGEVQVAFLVVTRKSTSAALRQRVDMALETFEVTGATPPKKRPKSSGKPSGSTATPTSPPPQSKPADF